MKYRIIWTKTAKSDLAAVWLAASDRNAVAAASHSLELQLVVSPFAFSESRGSFFRPHCI